MFRYEFEETALILLERAAYQLRSYQNTATVEYVSAELSLYKIISDFLEQVESEGIQFN